MCIIRLFCLFLKIHAISQKGQKEKTPQKSLYKHMKAPIVMSHELALWRPERIKFYTETKHSRTPVSSCKFIALRNTLSRSRQRGHGESM